MPGDRFAWGAETLWSQCVYCQRLVKSPDAVCHAFPGGIPDAIPQNKFDHRKPYTAPVSGQPLDTGLTGTESLLFVPRESVPQEVIENLGHLLDKLTGGPPT
jgi:hypothetical protein